jgi:putative PIN family toxin of toxin-antitoxin system
VSPEIVAEVGDVLNRPKVRRMLPALTDEAVEAFLQDVLSRATTLSEVPEAFPLERDPKDERDINLAIASGASYLVTWDRDLLDLMDDEGFCRRFPRDPAETAPE